MRLTTCWTPFFWHNNIRDGALAAAAYSALFCLFVLTYTTYVMSGGDSSELWSPFFETNLRSSLTGWGTFTLVYFLLMAAATFLLVMGILRDVRGLMLPWLFMMGLVVLFQVRKTLMFNITCN